MLRINPNTFRPLSKSTSVLLRSITTLEHQSKLDSKMLFSHDRRTKIVATMGPSSIVRLPELLMAGINVARINCAHGDAEQYAGICKAVRAAEREVRISGSAHLITHGEGLCGSRRDIAAIAFDVKGPEIRIGRFAADVPFKMINTTLPDGSIKKVQGNKEIPLSRGDRFILTTDPKKASEGRKGEVYISYGNICKQVQPGQVIFVDDGNIELRVIEVHADKGELVVESITSVALSERKNVNLPGLVVDLPAVTAKDEVDLATAKRLGADFIFASFVQSADAVRQIRKITGPDMRIISKIESQEGVDNIDAILRASDGIMVARGDLGVQIPAERVFLAQKSMIAQANILGKVVICATQMLDSMVHSPRPTRAEVVDVASAVLDGADAVMLSGETAKGSYPLEAVQTMSRICVAAEAAYPSRSFFTALSNHPAVPVGVDDDESLLYHEIVQVKNFLEGKSGAEGGEFTDDSENADFMTVADVETIGSAAVHAAFETKAVAIVVASISGRTASLVAKYRPNCPVICLVSDEAVGRQLMLRRGVHVILMPAEVLDSANRVRSLAMGFVKDLGIGKKGDRVVLVQSQGDVPTAAVTLTQVH